MKLLILISCFFFLFSCHKDRTINYSQDLAGKWELRRIEYGYSIQPDIQFMAGNGNVISFSGSDEYNRTDITGNDIISSSGNYRITNSATCSSKTVAVINFSGGYYGSSILMTKGDSLYFTSDGCVMADGVERTYVKVK